MPEMLGPFGIVPFAAVKFVGYCYAGLLLDRQYPTVPSTPELMVLRERPRSAIVFGATRTLLGLTAGGMYATFWYLAGADPGNIGWWIGLLPVRLFEWCVMIWWFFDRRMVNRAKDIKNSVWGTVWSYALDMPALVAGWVTPGATWVC